MKAAAALLVCLCLLATAVTPWGTNDASAATARPDKAAMKSLTAYSSTSIKVRWYGVDHAKGYQVRYSRHSDMSACKTYTGTSSKQRYHRLKDLHVHSKYYVQVRGYNLTKSGTKVLGRWSDKMTMYTNYAISYTLNGGKQADGQRYSYNSKSSTIKLLTPKRSGYLFLGWYSNASFVGKKVATIPTGSTGSKHFYARWVSKTAPNDEFVFKWCASQGMTKTCAAAIVGNAMQESKCNPESYSSSGKSYGMFQWTGKRAQRLKEIAAEKGKTWKDRQCQLTLLMEELTDTSKSGCFYLYTGYTRKYSNGTVWGWKDDLTYKEWSTWTDISDATKSFERIYERASIPRMDNRIAYAKAAYAAYK